MAQVVTYTGKKLMPLYPAGDNPARDAIKLATGTYVYGQLVKESATPGTYEAVDDGTDTDGTHFLVYDVVVDASGIHWLGQQAANEIGAGDLHTSAYAAGGGLSYDTRDLCINAARGAITTAQIAALGAKLISGTAAAGIIQF
jgi:hypothetical protein